MVLRPRHLQLQDQLSERIGKRACRCNEPPRRLHEGRTEAWRADSGSKFRRKPSNQQDRSDLAGRSRNPTGSNPEGSRQGFIRKDYARITRGTRRIRMEGRHPLVRRTNVRPNDHARPGLASFSRWTGSRTSRDYQNGSTGADQVLVSTNAISHRRVRSEVHYMQTDEA
jgi:hypothetical protein